MTKKQEVRAVVRFLSEMAVATAKKALADGVTEEDQQYNMTKSVIIRDLLTDLKTYKDVKKTN